MADISIRKAGKSGRITLTRERALNALSYEMCLAIEDAIDAWRNDPDVALVIIDAAGEKAFCAGGDIAELYETGTKGDYSYGRKFWADEYRLNNKLKTYSKPIISLMQGFTMGGGVGIGCHGSHRIVCETSQMAMPECGIGLVPDVGGSYILANAPGKIGAYLGATAYRMDAADAIYTGFADHFISKSVWPELINSLEDSGDISLIASMSQPVLPSRLEQQRTEIDQLFATTNLAELAKQIEQSESELAQQSAKSLNRNSPLAMAVTLKLVETISSTSADLAQALTLEYRYTYRAMEHGDFLEGIRAAIIDKDRNPRWRQTLYDVDDAELNLMMAPLGEHELSLREE